MARIQIRRPKKKPTVCIYCGASTLDRKQGDHVVPARLGKFKNDAMLRFYGLCRRCDSMLGRYDQELISKGPEPFILNMLEPTIERSHRATSRGKVVSFEENGVRKKAVIHSGKEFEATSPEQLIYTDSQGNNHPVQLNPNMTSAGLEKSITRLKKSLSDGVQLTDKVHMSVDGPNRDHYLTIMRERRPEMKVGEFSVTPPGTTNDVEMRHEMLLTADYFRALAKIAFHYYLINSPRGLTGGEKEFRPIREYLKGGGRKEDFFMSKNPFLLPFNDDTKLGLTTKNWNHVLLGAEQMDRAIVSLTLFIGPNQVPKTYPIKIAYLNFKVSYFKQSFGHVYEYYEDPSVGPYAGIVRSEELISFQKM